MEITTDVYLRGTAWNRAIDGLSSIFKTRTHYMLYILSLTIGIMYDQRIEKPVEENEEVKSVPRNVIRNNDTDISRNTCSEAKLNFFNWMIEDIRARGIELLVVDDVSNLVSRENCWYPIEKLRKIGIKVISLPTARILPNDHIIFKEPKQKKKHKEVSSMTHQKMREEWYKDLREHHRCTFEALANKK